MSSELEYRIYLASQSPRRRELLSQIGVRFEVLDISVTEELKINEAPIDYVLRVATDKAMAGIRQRGKSQIKSDKSGLSNWQSKKKPSTIELVVAADTAVVCDGKILGKPESDKHAAVILKQLSGKTHELYTGVVVAGSRILMAVSRTLVDFKHLDSSEIRRYIATKEGCDKAGSYAVQGLAAIFIENINGSYSGVMNGVALK